LIVNVIGAVAGASAAWQVVQPPLIPAWFILPGTNFTASWHSVQACVVGICPLG